MFKIKKLVRFVAFLGLLSVGITILQAAVPGAGTRQRNFDARVSYNAAFTARISSIQRQALNSLRLNSPSIRVGFDNDFGTARILNNSVDYLSPPQPGADPLSVGLSYVNTQLDLIGLNPADLTDYEVTDTVPSAVTGAVHIYLRQQHRGISVYNGQLHFNLNRDVRLLSVNNSFVARLATSVNSATPAIDAAEAILSAANHLGMTTAVAPLVEQPATAEAQQTTQLRANDISLEPIEARLMWLPIRQDEVRLVWNFQILTLDQNHQYDFTVDAENAQVWTRFDWVADAAYRVYPLPAESPNHVTPLPPADGRTIVTNPQDATASPLGWHNDGSTAYTIMRGNNVHAYDDAGNNNAPPGTQPDCGAGLNCDFNAPINFATQDPNTYTSAAVANLFYWNNIIHDVQYQYGFDEVAGNFQNDNSGKGGIGADFVQAEAQDGAGLNNANFATPPDGSKPRMQMFLWNQSNPRKDGDFDSGIIIHEYGHGISSRLVGGPSNVSCLGNDQQPGEGLSDWWTLAYTHEVGDAGTDSRGVGSYVLNQPVNGTGIRTQPYSTNPAINNHTYQSINGMVIPHGVGEVWAQAAWEVYWKLVDLHGFDPDLYDAMGGAGNQRMMLYVNEGLKNTACSPAFTDVRDGILQAALDNYNGEDVCPMWEAFAAFGLGVDAVSGGSSSTSPTNGFDIPDECKCDPGQTIPVADAGPDKMICKGGYATIGTPALAKHTYLWSPGGKTTAQISVSPLLDTTYTIAATTDCGTVNDSVHVFVTDTGSDLSDDFENGLGNWTTSGLWHLTSNSNCASPALGYASPVNAVYYGLDNTCTYNTGSATSGDLLSPLILADANSSLSFNYFRVVESFAGDFDKTVVDVVTNSGATTVFSLNSSNPSTASWTSSGPISLAAFAGQTIRIRFRFDSVDGQSNTFKGWFIDDVVVTSNALDCSTPPSFVDVPNGYFAEAEIYDLVERTIATACDNNKFCPNDVAPRGLLVIWLLRALGESPDNTPGFTVYADVPETHVAYGAIQRLNKLGLTGNCGLSPNRFCPDDSLTRAQIVVYLLRALSLTPDVSPGSPYTDVSELYYAYGAIKKLNGVGVLGECSTGKFCPDDAATRAQLALYLARAFPTMFTRATLELASEDQASSQSTDKVLTWEALSTQPLSFAQLPTTLQSWLNAVNAEGQDFWSNGDGTLIVFSSDSDALVEGDTNGVSDVFLYDDLLFNLRRISVDSAGAQGNEASTHPRIDGLGHSAVFVSEASNLAAEDDNGVADIFGHELSTGITERLSSTPTGEPISGPADHPSIAGDGSRIAYDVLGENGLRQVYSQTLDAVASTQISDTSTADGLPLDAFRPGLSVDGRYLSYMQNVDAELGLGCSVQVHDMVSETFVEMACSSALVEFIDPTVMFTPEGDTVRWFDVGSESAQPVEFRNPLSIP